jgi:hypothetical protein
MTPEIEATIRWTGPDTGKPTEAFWRLWKVGKQAVKAAGYGVRLEGSQYVVQRRKQSEPQRRVKHKNARQRPPIGPAHTPPSPLFGRYGKKAGQKLTAPCDCRAPCVPRAHAIAGGQMQARVQCTACGWVAKNPVPLSELRPENGMVDLAAFDRFATARTGREPKTPTPRPPFQDRSHTEPGVEPPPWE